MIKIGSILSVNRIHYFEDQINSASWMTSSPSWCVFILKRYETTVTHSSRSTSALQLIHPYQVRNELNLFFQQFACMLALGNWTICKVRCYLRQTVLMMLQTSLIQTSIFLSIDALVGILEPQTSSSSFLYLNFYWDRDLQDVRD